MGLKFTLALCFLTTIPVMAGKELAQEVLDLLDVQEPRFNKSYRKVPDFFKKKVNAINSVEDLKTVENSFDLAPFTCKEITQIAYYGDDISRELKIKLRKSYCYSYLVRKRSRLEWE